jgi:hypothetical protein
LKKLMLVAAMLAMVLAAAVPALAQSVTQVGSGNVACVQTAVQAEVGKVQISQYGNNVNVQNIAQVCNVSAGQVQAVVSSATASASAPAVQYQYAAPQAQYSAPTASPAAQLPPTGGSSLIALGAGVLLVAGGLLARRIVR